MFLHTHPTKNLKCPTGFEPASYSVQESLYPTELRTFVNSDALDMRQEQVPSGGLEPPSDSLKGC